MSSGESGQAATHRGDLAVHEDTSEIELNLETDVDVGAAAQGSLATFLPRPGKTAKGTHLIVGLHQSVKRRLGIWLSPER